MSNPMQAALTKSEAIVKAYAHLSTETEVPSMYGATEYVVKAILKNGDELIESPASFDAAMDMIEDYLDQATTKRCHLSREVNGKIITSKFSRTAAGFQD